jgi:hypothetical protein
MQPLLLSNLRSSFSSKKPTLAMFLTMDIEVAACFTSPKDYLCIASRHPADKSVNGIP